VNVLVVGVGHPDRGDDAVGLHVIEQLEPEGVAGVVLRRQTGDPSGVLLDPLWEQADLVVLVDSTRTGAPVGTVTCRDARDLLGGGVTAPVTHEFGVAATIQLAEALDRLPARLTLVGIEAGDLAHGAPLSGPVREAVAVAVDLVRRLTLTAV
jgi:hydrogenase maturation protease